MSMRREGYHIISRERLSVDQTSGGTGFTAAKRKPTTGDAAGFTAKIVYVKVEGAGITWTSDGTAPTATTGRQQFPLDEFEVMGPTEISQFRAFAQTGTDATLDCEFGI